MAIDRDRVRKLAAEKRPETKAAGEKAPEVPGQGADRENGTEAGSDLAALMRRMRRIRAIGGENKDLSEFDPVTEECNAMLARLVEAGSSGTVEADIDGLAREWCAMQARVIPRGKVIGSVGFTIDWIEGVIGSREYGARIIARLRKRYCQSYPGH